MSGTYPKLALACTAWRSTSKPMIAARPEEGRRRPVSILMVVVLPAPLGPRKPTISPRATARLTPRTASWLP